MPEEGKGISGPEPAEHLTAPALSGSLRPPPLRNTCFALPAGVDWTPVDTVLTYLRDRLGPVTAVETIPLVSAQNRVVARDVTARRSNPAHANSAVDGYGFAGGLAAGAHVLPLMAGRAAAGAPLNGAVPPGHAVRILTGAILPQGVDTVVLQEDVTVGATAIALRGPIRPGANTRKAGEDVLAGEPVLAAGARISAPDLALAGVTGIAGVPVHAPLRVAILSTGDELVPPGTVPKPGQIHDANRPMLAGLVRDMGFTVVDAGIIPDDRAKLRRALDTAAASADVILTSGGASAGDEDHLSALMTGSGAMQHWRIAVKPGRPLALGFWHDRPVFGLPGNPVAAFVCTLVFAAPALRRLSGMAWQVPRGLLLPAAFDKCKKAGRREYLRARLRGDVVEVFGSEGSGRISGLCWGTGLVELDDGARDIAPGDTVRYIPYVAFLNGS